MPSRSCFRSARQPSQWGKRCAPFAAEICFSLGNRLVVVKGWRTISSRTQPEGPANVRKFWRARSSSHQGSAAGRGC